MARRRKRATGREVVDLSSEIANMAKGNPALEEKIASMLSGQEKMSSNVESELKRLNDRLIKDARKLKKEIIDLTKAEGRLTREKRQRVKDVQKELSDLTKKIDITDKLTGSQEDMGTSLSSLAAGTKNLTIHTAILMGALSALKQVIDAVVATYNFWFDIESKIVEQQGQMAMAIGGSAGQMERLNAEAEGLRDTFSILTGDVLGLEAFRFVQEAQQSFRQMLDTVPGLTTNLLQLSRGFGIGAEQASTLFRMVTTGVENPVARMEEFTATVRRLGDQLQVPAGILIRDYLQARNNISQFGREGERVFRNAALMARRFGLETQKIFEAVRGFDTFQQASQNVNQLNAMFGTTLSSFELMMEQDPTQRLEMVRGAIMDMGLEWDQMNRFQRLQLSQTLNMSEEELARMFRDGVSFAELENERIEREREQQRQQEMQISNQEMMNDLLSRTTTFLQTLGFWWERIKIIVVESLSPIFEVIQETIAGTGSGLFDWVKALVNSKEYQEFIREIAIDIRDLVVDIQEFVAKTDWSQFREDGQRIWEIIKETYSVFKDFVSIIGENRGSLSSMFDINFDFIIGSFRMMNMFLQSNFDIINLTIDSIRDLIEWTTRLSQGILGLAGLNIEMGGLTSPTSASASSQSVTNATNISNAVRNYTTSRNTSNMVSPIVPTYTPTASSPKMTTNTNMANMANNQPIVVHTHITTELDGEVVARKVATKTVQRAVSGRQTG